MPEHSPEPWTFVLEDEMVSIEDANGEEVVCEGSYTKVDDLKIIVACVNALSGLNPEAVREVIEAAIEADKHFNDRRLREALKRVRG